MSDLDTEAVLSERLRRHRFTQPLEDSGGYIELFRSLQPVSPVFFSCPGEPPRLGARTQFDDGAVADRLRGKRVIVKGRFLGGGIGYVLAEDLPVYANAFRKPLAVLNLMQEQVLEAVRNAGPLAPRQIKEETGLLNKHIMPAVHRLQRAFLVFEDQIDSDWERGWYDFGAEWPEVGLSEKGSEESVAEVLRRFLKPHVFATFEQVKDWSQLPARTLKRVLGEMEAMGRIVPCEVARLGEGWRCAEDSSLADNEVPPSVFMLHKADPLLRSHASELKRRFAGEEVLQYLLIDGAFQGAVVGHWRIGPHDVDDIVLTVGARERTQRKEEILAVVGEQYAPPRSRILKYAGRRV